MAADTGPCGANKERFYYNVTVGECQIFEYSGCRGNKNNFLTINECQRQCVKVVPTTTLVTLKSTQQVVDTQRIQTQEGRWILNNTPILIHSFFLKEFRDIRCSLPADPGFCRGRTIYRFFYDSTHRECRKFLWGGCLGKNLKATLLHIH